MLAANMGSMGKKGTDQVAKPQFPSKVMVSVVCMSTLAGFQRRFERIYCEPDCSSSEYKEYLKMAQCFVEICKISWLEERKTNCV